MALLILVLLQRIFLMSSLMLLLVWLIFFMVLIKLLPILGTISGKSVDRKSGSAGMPRPNSYAVFCLKKKQLVHEGRRAQPSHPQGRARPAAEDRGEGHLRALRARSRLSLSSTGARKQ